MEQIIIRLCKDIEHIQSPVAPYLTKHWTIHFQPLLKINLKTVSCSLLQSHAVDFEYAMNMLSMISAQIKLCI